MATKEEKKRTQPGIAKFGKWLTTPTPGPTVPNWPREALRDVGTMGVNIGKGILERVSGTTGIPRGKYTTPGNIRSFNEAVYEGRQRIKSELAGVAIKAGGVPAVKKGVPTGMTDVEMTAHEKMLAGRLGEVDEAPAGDYPKGTWEKQADGKWAKVPPPLAPGIYAVPKGKQAKFGEKYLTNRGVPDFTKAGLGLKGGVGATYSLGGQTGIPPWMQTGDGGKEPALPEMDFSSWPNIIKSIQSLAPYAAKTGIARDRLKREKAALSMGLDSAKMKKAVQETLAIPYTIDTKRAKTALSIAKEDRMRKKDAFEMARNPLTGEEGTPEKVSEYERWLGNKPTTATKITQAELDAAVKKYGVPEEEVKKRYAQQYGISVDEIEVTP